MVDGLMLSLGRTLHGRKTTFKVIEAIQEFIFKAQPSTLFPRSSLVVVKTAAGPEQLALKREYTRYQLPAIAQSPHIRTLHDVTGPWQGATASEIEEPQCLIFEYFESTLGDVDYEKLRTNPVLVKKIAKTTLSALATLADEGFVHTDISINNIFVSDINSPEPYIKVGDLGNVVDNGIDHQLCQPLPCRAPEVWQGHGCWHVSDVWSVGVTLAHALSPFKLFSTQDKIVQDLDDAWSIAKIIRLIGPIPGTATKPEYEENFVVGNVLATDTFVHPDTGIKQPFIVSGRLREQLNTIPGARVPEDLLDFMDYLLTIDYRQRPTAKQALQHPYLQDT